MIRANPQHGYILLPVVLLITLVATSAFLLNNESALDSGITASNLEAKQAEYVAKAGLKHALWQAGQQDCGPYTDLTNQPLGTHSYTTTLTSGLGSTTSYTIAVDQDTWIRSDQPTVNKANDSKLHIRFESGTIERPMYRYDLSPIAANSNILSATAWFYVNKEHPEGPVDIHLLNVDWSETDATWEAMGDKMDALVQATIPTQPAAGVWVAVNLTSQVQAWVNGYPNFGITLNSLSEGTHGEYASIEAGQQPYLEVITGTAVSPAVKLKSQGTLSNGVGRTMIWRDVRLYQQPSHRVLQPASVKDVMLSAFYSSKNYGDHRMRVSTASGSLRNSLIQFDLSAIPAGAKVLSAQMQLHHTITDDAGADAAVSVHRVTSDWVEGTQSGGGTADGATWNTFDGSTAWTTPGGDYDPAVIASSPITGATGDWESWDISTLVRGWVDGRAANNGLLLKGTGTINVSFASKEDADPALHPKLSITYACECGSPCLAPQTANGAVLMVVVNTSTLVAQDAYKKALFESWGYTVTLVGESANQSTYDAAIAVADVVFISETVNASQVGTKLAGVAIGVVSQDGIYNNDLGFASSSAWTVAPVINLTDTSHYITNVFPLGPLEVYSAAMEQLTVSGTMATGLQTLADAGGTGSLVVLDTGAIGTGGAPVPARRVMLPLGRDSNFNWDYLNANGRLLLHRALQWGMEADKLGAGKQLLLVVGDDVTLSSRDAGRKALIESWGYAVTVIDDGDSQANFDAAAAAANVVYITGSIGGGTLANKLTGSSVPIVNEFYGKLDNFGFSSSTGAAVNADGFSGTDAGHYITQPFGGGAVTVFSGALVMPVPSGTLAPDLQNIGEVSGTATLVTLDAGATRHDGNPVPARRVHLPFALAETTDLTADGETILKRALEWAGGAGCGTTKSLLMLVGDAANPTVEELSRQTLLESWCYSVSTVTASEPQATYDTFADNYDVVYVPASVNYADVASKLKLQPVGVVNEVGTLTAYLGFTSGTSGYPGTVTELTDNTHYITTVLALGNLAITTTSTSLRTFVNTMGPGFRTLSTRPSYTDPMIMILDTGDELLWGGNAPDRRVMLPWGGSSTFHPNNLTTDGQTILRRALEWAAGAGPVSAPAYNILMIVGDAGSLSVQDAARKSLLEGWGYAVTVIDDGDSQANFDTSAAAVDVAYVTESVNLAALGKKLKAATIGVVNEDPALHDVFGFSTNRYLSTDNPPLATDAAHYITSPFGGATVLALFSSSQPQGGAVGTLPSGLQTIGNWSGGSLSPLGGLLVLDTGAAISGGGTAAGRRVQLPWGGEDGISVADITSLTADGKTILQRALEWGANAGGGGGPGPGSCDGTFRDEFNLRQYDQNDGTLAWATNWEETGETTDPTSDDIRIDADISDFQLMLRDDGQTVWREADLSEAGSATLSFDYRRENLKGIGDYVAVEVSYDGGSNWTELDRFTGDADDTSYTSTSYPLDSAQLSANTRIRFKTPGNGMKDNNQVWFDNIQIQCQP